jgi:LETM1 and EF-hand domain-containing protein 1, mitochondrial
VTESIDDERNLATEEMDPTTEQTREEIKAKALKKHEQICKISQALAVLASASVRKTYFTLSN